MDYCNSIELMEEKSTKLKTKPKSWVWEHVLDWKQNCQCKYCGKYYSKNASRLNKHLQKCLLNSTLISTNDSTNRIKSKLIN